MKGVQLKKLKQVEFFTLKPIEYPNENQVYIKGEYVRSEKQYLCDKFSDISIGRYLKGDRLVYTDFIF